MSLFSGLPSPPSIDAYAQQPNIPFTLKYLLADIDTKWHSNPTVKAQMKSFLLSSRQSLHHQMQATKATKTTSGGTGLKTVLSVSAVVDPELYAALERVIRELKAYTPYSIPFLVKVNKKDVPDYYSVIKVPMDLGTMTKKLRQKEYNSKQQFLQDLEQIYTNCFLYNTAEDSIYRQHVQMLRDKWTFLIKSVPDDKDDDKPQKANPTRPDGNTQERDVLDTLLSAHLESLSDLESEPSPKKSRLPSKLDIFKCSDQFGELLSNFPSRSAILMHQYSKDLFNRQKAHKQLSSSFASSQEEAQIMAASRPSFFPELLFFFNTVPDAHLYATAVRGRSAPSYSTKAAVADVVNRIKALDVLRGKRLYLLDSTEDSFVERSIPVVDFDKIGSVANEARALKILEKVCVLYLAQFGFERISRASLNCVTHLVHQRICNLFRTYRLLYDNYYPSKESYEILSLSMMQAGCTVGELEETLMKEASLFARKISRMEAALDDALAEMEEWRRMDGAEKEMDKSAAVAEEEEDGTVDDQDDLSLLDTELEPLDVIISTPVDQDDDSSIM